MPGKDFKIFSSNRLRLSQLREDALSYIRRIYNTEGEEFTMSSPFGQIVNVITSLGRMILFYIENTITELNIKTAFHERSIKGLSVLTGHNPSSGIAARGALRMTYRLNSDYNGETITINNYTKILNSSNGLTYLALLPNSSMSLTVGANDSNIQIPIIQGTLKYQQATGTGYAMQSFNFANKNGDMIDNFFRNIYVNGEQWRAVDSFLDMGYEENVYVAKQSIDGGVDVFFGTGINGRIPERGSSIVFEYLTTKGPDGNISETEESYWEFEDTGIDINGEAVDLNSIYVLNFDGDVIFGTSAENIEVTRKLAPHISRSFVLANASNYRYFLSKLGIFSIIDAFTGFNTIDDQKIETEYANAKAEYQSLKESYSSQVNLTGKSSADASALYQQMAEAKDYLDSVQSKYNDSILDDNIVYLYLVPDINKRINASENYFTCSEDAFILSDNEKDGILNLIEDSGQKIMTVENRIIDPIFVRFSINIFIQMWNNYDFNAVKSSIISAVSDYLISNTRRDRIPLSDLIRIVEGVAGVDSVTLFFDADKNNATYYGEENYGIDEYGDIVLSRQMTDRFGNTIEVNDLLPLFRGPFISADGIEYSDDLDALTSTINITLRGRSDTNRQQ